MIDPIRPLRRRFLPASPSPRIWVARGPEALMRVRASVLGHVGPQGLTTVGTEHDRFVILTLKGYLDCHALGYPVTPLANWITADDWSAWDALARRLLRPQGPGDNDAEMPAFLRQWSYRGVGLWDLIGVENLIFFRELVYAYHLAARLSAQFPGSEFCLGYEPGSYCLESRRHGARHGLSERLLGRFLAHHGATVRGVELGPRERWPIIPLTWKLAARRGMRVLLRKGRTVAPAERPPHHPRPSPLGPPVPTGPYRLIQAFGTEVDLHGLASVLAERRDALQSESLVPVVGQLINNESHVVPLVGRAGIDQDRLSAYPMLHLPLWREGEAAVQSAEHDRLLSSTWSAWTAWAQSRPQRFDVHDSNVWSWLRLAVGDSAVQGHFQVVWDRLQRQVLPHIDRVLALWVTHPPEAVWVANVERAQDRATVELAKQRKVPTCAVPHGYLGDVDHFDFATDRFLAWGPAGQRHLSQHFGQPQERIGVLPPHHWIQLPIQAPLQTQEPITGRNSPRRKLLVLTARASALVRDPIDPVGFLAAWSALAEWAKAREDVEVWIKPHPGGSDQVAWYEQWCAALGAARARVCPPCRLEDILGDVTGVLGMIDPSTAYLITARYRVPIVYGRLGWRPGAQIWAVQSFGGDDGLVSVDAVADLAPTLNQLCDNPEFRQRCLHQGDRLLTAQWALSNDPCLPNLNPS